MDVFRKSLKAYIAAMILFIAFTAILAAMVTFTGFKEEWTFAGLIVSMTVSAMHLGYLESRVIGKRGLISGALSALIICSSDTFGCGRSFFRYAGGIEAYTGISSACSRRRCRRYSRCCRRKLKPLKLLVNFLINIEKSTCLPLFKYIKSSKISTV